MTLSQAAVAVLHARTSELQASAAHWHLDTPASHAAWVQAAEHYAAAGFVYDAMLRDENEKRFAQKGA